MFKFLVLFLLVCGSFAYCQIQYTDTTIFNAFDTGNLDEWDEWDTEESAASVSDGYYKIEHKRVESSYAYWQSFQLHWAEDFSIETKLTQTEGTDNYGYGMIWAFTDWDNYNTFLISPSGYFSVYSKYEGEEATLQAWVKDPVIKGLDTANTLKILQTGENIQFIINGKNVLTLDKSQFKPAGSYIGYLLYTNKKVNVDFLTLKGKYPKVNLVKDAVKGYKRENLGANINSIYSDQGPFITADGNTLYFIRKKSPENVGGEEASGEDDAWYAEKQADGSWSKAKNMGSPINNSSNNFIVSISADNNTLFIANLYNPDGSSNGQGLSKSTRTATGWSLPTEVKIEDYYNEGSSVDFFVSQDQQFVICALQRKDSEGSLDLYVCKKTGDNVYSAPMSLGKTVNTSSLEMSPFLASDNRTLYFSTKGHPGMGNNDIFVTRRLNDTWQNWSTPENLGPEINSRFWEGDFSIPASGEYAYMASFSHSIGRADIVKIKLSDAARPHPVVLVKGTVLNKKTNEPLQADIFYYDIETHQEVGKAISNPITGQYNIILQAGKKYSFRAQKENFYAINDFLDVSVLNSYTEKEKILYLVPLEVGQTIRLNNIFFDFNQSVLKPTSEEELNRLVQLLQHNPSMEIEISGHTDSQGADDYNLNLSQQRVESVLKYLISKGISSSRLKGKGYGESKPIANNTTEEGRAVNRRVDFTILKQ